MMKAPDNDVNKLAEENSNLIDALRRIQYISLDGKNELAAINKICNATLAKNNNTWERKKR